MCAYCGLLQRKNRPSGNSNGLILKARRTKHLYYSPALLLYHLILIMSIPNVKLYHRSIAIQHKPQYEKCDYKSKCDPKNCLYNTKHYIKYNLYDFTHILYLSNVILCHTVFSLSNFPISVKCYFYISISKMVAEIPPLKDSGYFVINFSRKRFISFKSIYAISFSFLSQEFIYTLFANIFIKLI